MFSRINFGVVRDFFVTKTLNVSLRGFFSAQWKRLTTFDHDSAWLKLQKETYNKQANHLDSFKAILADPKKLNAALSGRGVLRNAPSNKTSKNQPLDELCGESFNPAEKLKDGKRVVDFMQASFKEFSSETGDSYKQLADSMNSTTASDDQRIAVMLSAVEFDLNASYKDSGVEQKIVKINEAKAKHDDNISVGDDPVFYPAIKQGKIKNNYSELRQMAQRAILKQRVVSKATSVEQKSQASFTLLQQDVSNALLKVSGNKTRTKTTNPFGFFAKPTYTKQEDILTQLSNAKDLKAMADIARAHVHTRYVALSPTMGPLLRSICKHADQINVSAKKRR